MRLLDLDARDAMTPPVDVAVEAGRIASIEPAGAGESRGRVLEASGMLAMPGLVNAHFHSSGTFNRGLVENLPLELFMLYEAPPFEFGPFPPELYRARALLGAVEMLRTGTTAVLDDPIYAPAATEEAVDAVMGAYRDAGIRATVTIYQPNLPEHRWMPFVAELLPADVVARLERERAPATAEIVAGYRRFVERWHGRADGRLRCAVSCSAPQRASEDYLLALHELAGARRLPFVMHVYESKVQRVAGELLHGGSLVRLVRRLGVLDERSCVVHAVWVDEADAADLAGAGAAVVHSPSGNLRCGSGVMPFRMLADAGVPIALCTDEATVEERSSMWSVGRLAAMLQTIAHPDPETWPRAREILRAMTAGGARAMGLEGQIGVLRPGARADLLLLDLGATPIADLPAHLVYGEDGSSVRLVMVDGRVVVRDGRVLTVDEEALREVVRAFVPRWLEALAPAGEWAARLRPAFEEVVRRCAVADVGMNRYAGDDGAWLARGRPGWSRAAAGTGT